MAIGRSARPDDLTPARRAAAALVALACVLPALGVLQPAQATAAPDAFAHNSVQKADPAPTPSEPDRPEKTEVEPTGDVIVRFKEGTGAASSTAGRAKALDAVSATSDTDLAPERTLSTGATLVQGGEPGDAAAIAERFEARPDVEYAEPDLRFRLAAAPNDPLYGPYQWDLSSYRYGIDAPVGWLRSQGSGVTVAVVDSGIVAHPDLAGQVVPGYDFISDPLTARDGTGRDNNPTDQGDWEQTDTDCWPEAAPYAASSWHGTHVAGTIGAVSGNGQGVAGVAPKARIQPVRVIGHCGGTLSDIADGIAWASGASVSGVPANGTPAKVVNVSLSGETTCPVTMQSAITKATQRGALVVTAAGNSSSAAGYEAPGNCTGVLNVAATARNGTRAWYSNYVDTNAIAAPGGDGDNPIISTVDKGETTPTGPDYGFMMGTSMAAPHVSGVAALVFSARPGLTGAQVRSILMRSARPFPVGCDRCGAGLVDAGRAVALATGTPLPRPPVNNATPVPAKVATGKARLAWSAFPGARGPVRYAVQWRIVNVGTGGVRSYGAWTGLTSSTTATSMWPAGLAGRAYQFRVRGTDAAGVVSAWSTPTSVGVPADMSPAVGSRTGTWRAVANTSAVSGSLVRTASTGATWTLPVTYASGVAVIVGKGPGYGTLDVYVDGTRRARVSTSATTLSGANTVSTVRFPYGRHSIRFVRVSGTVALDAVAYVR